MMDTDQAADAAAEDLEHSDLEADAAPEPEARQRERTQRKDQKRLDALTWTPPDSAAVLYEDLSLGHKTLQRNFNLWFVRSQIAMYKLQSDMADYSSDEQFRGAGEVVEMQLQEIEKELADEHARLLEVAKAEGIESFPAKGFNQPVTLRVPKYTPGAGRVLRLIRKLDDLFWALDVLFISGSIKSDHKNNLINRWKRLMWGLVRAQTQVWVRVRDSLRDQGVGPYRHRRVAPAGREVGKGGDASPAVDGAEGVTADAAKDTQSDDDAEATAAKPRKVAKATKAAARKKKVAVPESTPEDDALAMAASG